MLKDNFIQIARAHGLRLSTERAYWDCARKHIAFIGAKSLTDLERDPTGQFRKHVTAIANDCPNRTEGDEGLSASTQNLYFHALRFLYEKVIGTELGDLSGIPRATVHKRIVDVPSDDIAKRIVESVPGTNGTAIRLIYGTAARLNDVLRLRMKDLDFRKKLVAIQESKGGKSRLVPMPVTLINELQQLCLDRKRIHESDLESGVGWVHMPGRLAKKYPNEEKSLDWQYVFCSDHVSKDPVSGKMGRHHIMATTLQRAFANARKNLKISRHYTIHSLRHACAQFWERNGISVSDIQQLLGHNDVDTTMGYLKSGMRGVRRVPSPL